MIKPIPQGYFTDSLADSLEMPADYTSAKFRLRDGLTFHDGTPLTTADVRWSDEHYQGVHAATFRDKTEHIEIIDDRTLIFHFKAPFLDFMDLYSGASTGIGWIVPQHYYEQVGPAGYMGKWWDQLIMRITDAWLTLPSLVFAILLSSIRGPGLWNVGLILALVFWSRYTRVVRGEVLSLRERDFVKLAEVNGVGQVAIIFHHLLPNVMNTVMVVFSLQVGISIIIEGSLSFLVGSECRRRSRLGA
jgi:Binding-protein-dependent transport system inner membrane component/Bacterial extracellular solute-binding proteins, family 5 Middle